MLHSLRPTLSRALVVLIIGLLSVLSSPTYASGGLNLLKGAQDALPQAQSEPDFLKVDEAFVFSSELTDQGLRLIWDIHEGYYLYLERFKFRTELAGVVIGEAQFSDTGKAKDDEYFGRVHVIYDALEVHLPIRLPAGTAEADIKITYQGCAEAGLCYPPRSQNVLFISSAEDASAGAPATNASSQNAPSPSNPINGDLDTSDGISRFLETASLPIIAGIFFLLGLGLTFTPCVFPMIPILSSIIAGQQHPTPLRSFLLAMAYVLGMALTYAAAGVITGLLGAGANIQAMMQDPLILSVFAAVFVALALAMFGFYELQLPAFVRDRLNTTSQSISGGQLSGVFFIGALSALVVSPCVSAPLAGALLYIGATGDAVIGGLSLFALGLGMGVPLLLIALGGGALLPRAGQWMDSVKAVFGVMLLAVAIWLLGRFVTPWLTMLLWSVLLIASANAMGAFEASQSGWPRLFKATGQILALWGALIFVGALSGGTNPLQPLDSLSQPTLMGQAPGNAVMKHPFVVIHDPAGLEMELAVAKASGKPAFLDFYADWCASCLTMENQVFPRPDIAPLMQEFHLIKADVTENDAGNQALLNKFGLFGPPSMIFFDPQGRELKPLRVAGEISGNSFRQRLEQVLSAQP